MQRTPRKLSEGLLIREAIQKKNCFETDCKNGFGPPPQKAFSLIHIIGIHSKSDFLNLQVAAIFCDFPPKSWQRTWKVQSWNCHVELSLSFRPNFGQLLLDIIWIFNYIVYFFLFTKMLFWHKLFLILMIYALLLRNFLSQFTHFFRQFLRAEKPLTPTYSLFGCMIIVGSGHLLFLGKPNIWAFKDMQSISGKGTPFTRWPSIQPNWELFIPIVLQMGFLRMAPPKVHFGFL